MKLIRQLRGSSLEKLAADQEQFYSLPRSDGEIASWQLDQFNRLWRSIQKQVPHYRRLREQGRVPEEFQRWSEFRDSMPILDRHTLRALGASLCDETRPADFQRTTGGSTAEPVQLAAWRDENRHASADLWFGRGWYGVEPADRLFLLWGHSHLLGRGWRGRINRWRREASDRLLGYRRWSAYDLSDAALGRAAEALLRQTPAYVLGYSVALDRFARANRKFASDFSHLGLKLVLATGESFPTPESRPLVAQVFGAPVAMEYGAVETGPIAYQEASGAYFVFWRHFAIEGIPADDLSGAWEVLVTALIPRCTPLIRYRLGDVVSGTPGTDGLLHRFSQVTGRCNDFVDLPEGGRVHSEAFTHVVRDSPTIEAFMVGQSGNGEITLDYVGPRELDIAEERELRRRLDRIAPPLARTRFRRVDRLEQTIAGKARRIRREERPREP